MKESDIIYLHWINGGFLSSKNIEEILKLGKPVFWFMHDMFPITGGCHHSFECMQYEDECRHCKFMQNDREFAARQLRDKVLLARYKNLHWIAPSKWLYECALKSSAIDNLRLHLIPNVMSDSFYPENQMIARNRLMQKLDLQFDFKTKYILFGADNVKKNPYKGFEIFLNALNEITTLYRENSELGVLFFGADYDEKIVNVIPFKTIFAGKIQDEEVMNDIYNASDVFVSASIAENFPLTVLESLSCQIPVAAFRTGGIPDMVNNECGAIAKEKNARSLAEAIIKVLKKENFNFAINNLCGKEIIIRQHKELWKETI